MSRHKPNSVRVSNRRLIIELSFILLIFLYIGYNWLKTPGVFQYVGKRFLEPARWIHLIPIMVLSAVLIVVCQLVARYARAHWYHLIHHKWSGALLIFMLFYMIMLAITGVIFVDFGIVGSIAVSIQIAGGLNNVFEHFFGYKGVTDYIPIGHFVANLGDVFTVIGLIGMLLAIWLHL